MQGLWIDTLFAIYSEAASEDFGIILTLLKSHFAMGIIL